MIQNGDLLDCKAEMIVQQCNCVTVKSHGLSLAISNKFPYADIYSSRSKKSNNTATTYSVPGTIVICEASQDGKPIVVNLLAQIAPGKSGSWNQQYGIEKGDDSAEKRLEYFKSCLRKLRREIVKRNIKSVAFPYKIGCGLAGGDWKVYKQAIEEFAERIPDVEVKILRNQ